jgi:hypothetical protein
LTPAGKARLADLAAAHLEELRRLAPLIDQLTEAEPAAYGA